MASWRGGPLSAFERFWYPCVLLCLPYNKINISLSFSMEQKSKVLTAVIALVTLVVGVFIGMGVQGGAFGQGKLTWMKDKGATQCEQYKAMFYQGTLTSTLGNAKTVQVLNNCTKNYATYWNAMPTLNECMMLKNRLDYYGATGFSEFLTKSKVSPSNGIYCASNYPFMWYDTGLTSNECYAYKAFSEGGGDITKLLGKATKAAKLSQCQNLINWPSNAVTITPDLCVVYKTTLDQGVLSDFIQDGKNDLSVALSCASNYPLLWYGVTKNQCLHYQAAQKQMMLTSNLGSTQKASDAITACNYAGFNLFSPIP